jgi:hypothetical protein
VTTNTEFEVEVVVRLKAGGRVLPPGSFDPMVHRRRNFVRPPQRE